LTSPFSLAVPDFKRTVHQSSKQVVEKNAERVFDATP